MAQIRVRLRGKTIKELKLSNDRTYVAGRKEECDIVLPSGQGISREHLRLLFINGSWNVEMISRYGELLQNGEQLKTLELKHGSAFTVPPYEFDFLMNSDLVDSSNSLVGINSGDEQNNFDNTVLGGNSAIAFIKVVDHQNEARELIRLEVGESWLAGRDATCHIHIRDQRVSRRQFEIHKNQTQYSILDLGSVNGTYLNGTPISSSQPTRIKSGDTIKVLDNNFYFELHDANFQNQLQLVDAARLNTPQSTDVSFLPEEYQRGQGQGLIQYPREDHSLMGVTPMMNPGAFSMNKIKSEFDFEKHRPKIIIGAVLVLLVAYLFGGNSQESADKAPSSSVNPIQQAFLKLKPEQQTLIRQRYKDTKNLYMAGKYQLAQDEIMKIREVVPDYEDIKDLDRLAKEAIFIQQQQLKIDQIAKDKAETAAKIENQVSICDKKVNKNYTEAELDECLSPVIQFDPDHPSILSLRKKVQELVSIKQASEAQKRAYQVDVARLKAIFSKAEKMKKGTNNPLDVIDAFQVVVRSSLPDPDHLKAKSQRNITSIRQMMNSKTASFQTEAEKLYLASNLKGAILALRKARQVDPENPELMPKIDQYVNELRKKMMVFYQEGILEESFGNVDGAESKAGAKDKWKKILDQDVSDGDYYKKAYLKLKKYGAN